MKEALLILLGALISCGTTFFLELVKSKREEKIYYKRKKEETYIEMQDLLTDLFAHLKEIQAGILTNDLRIRYNKIKSKASSYGKKEVIDNFYTLANKLMCGKLNDDYAENNDNLIKLIRKDLKIED